MAYFSVPEVSLNGIITVTRCRTLVFLERNIPFPDAQSCFTCTCKTTLHTEASYVTLQEGTLSIPEKEMDSNGRQHLA